jgi:hypothetical protein
METIDPDIFRNLMMGLYTCYWCGGIEDIDHIADHVDNCLLEVRWLNVHFGGKDDAAHVK